MNPSFAIKFIAVCSMFTGANALFAHVSLPPGGAAAGSEYEAAFRVSHACKDAKTTTGITLHLPEGFSLAHAQPRAGWTLASSAREVRWSAESARAALPDKEHAEFIVRGKLAATPGTLWFKVLQTCDTGTADWAQIPAPGATEQLAMPAARLDVLPPGVAAVDVKDAWVRASVPGQSGTGAFMQLSAPSGARLVGASTPVAGVAEVHEMKMEGDTMKMRAVPALDLPPRTSVELRPGGLHLMLMDLKQPIVNGSTVPVTLRFEDAKGAQSALELKLPVRPAAVGAAPATGHDHRH